MKPYPDLTAYVRDLFVPRDAELEAILEETPSTGLPAISIKPEEGRFLQFLVRAISARRALEIGTLGGYSGIWIARGLAPGGRLLTLEVEAKHAQVARQNFIRAGVADLVEIRMGNAHQSLQELSGEPEFDFIFIDAEKTGYPAYMDWALEHVRLGGVIAAHNAFRKGSVAGLAAQDQYTEVTDAFNRKAAAEARLISTIFPAGDGTLVAVKVS